MRKRYLKFLNHEAGVTLIEILIATLVLVPLFAGLMVTFIKSAEIARMAQNSTSAVWAAKNRIAQIDNTAFSNVFNTFHNVTFSPVGLNGMGVTYVDNSDPQLLQITTTVCWRESNGRVVGEDSDVDGVLDAGEDTNANGLLDSPVQFVTLRFNDS